MLADELASPTVEQALIDAGAASVLGRFDAWGESLLHQPQLLLIAVLTPGLPARNDLDTLDRHRDCHTDSHEDSPLTRIRRAALQGDTHRRNTLNPPIRPAFIHGFKFGMKPDAFAHRALRLP